jgi:hypothetical protein
MSHCNRWWRNTSIGLSISTRVVCTWRSLSTNSWLSLFIRLEWIHPSMDHQCSQGEPDLHWWDQGRRTRGEGGHSWRKLHECPPSPRPQSDVVHTMLSVEIDKVIRNLMSWRRTFRKSGSSTRERWNPDLVITSLHTSLNSVWVTVFTRVFREETIHQTFFFYIRIFKYVLLVSLYLDVYSSQDWHVTSSKWTTCCVFWRCTHSDRPLLTSWSFINGGVHWG